MDRVDPRWTVQNDLQSVTVGINTRLWICKKQGFVPTLIRLGRAHTRLLLREHGLRYIPNRPFSTAAGLLQWDPDRRCITYGRQRVPMKLNDRLIYGIAVEGKPSDPERRKPTP